jgi:hypothetical protein
MSIRRLKMVAAFLILSILEHVGPIFRSEFHGYFFYSPYVRAPSNKRRINPLVAKALEQGGIVL